MSPSGDVNTSCNEPIRLVYYCGCIKLRSVKHRSLLFPSRGPRFSVYTARYIHCRLISNFFRFRFSELTWMTFQINSRGFPFLKPHFNILRCVEFTSKSPKYEDSILLISIRIYIKGFKNFSKKLPPVGIELTTLTITGSKVECLSKWAIEAYATWQTLN